MNLLEKLKGDNAALPPRATYKNIALGFAGGFIAIALLASLTNTLSTMLILGSFGASCVILFALPDAPFAQPRNVIGGHVISSLVGLACMHFFGAQWWSVALAVGAAIALMMATRTVHPPAGSNPVIVYLSHPAWSFLLFPTLIGAILLVIISLLYNNMVREGKYPKYWF